MESAAGNCTCRRPPPIAPVPRKECEESQERCHRCPAGYRPGNPRSPGTCRGLAVPCRTRQAPLVETGRSCGGGVSRWWCNRGRCDLEVTPCVGAAGHTLSRDAGGRPAVHGYRAHGRGDFAGRFPDGLRRQFAAVPSGDVGTGGPAYPRNRDLDFGDKPGFFAGWTVPGLLCRIGPDAQEDRVDRGSLGDPLSCRRPFRDELGRRWNRVRAGD